MKRDKKLLIEELKLLFLRCRAPNFHVFNNLIISVYPELCGQLYKDEVAGLRHECSLRMSDYRHKYLKVLREMAREYLENTK